MRISDWSSDVCSSDLILGVPLDFLARCPVRFIVDGRDHAQIVPQRGDVFHLGRRFREAVERDERVVIVEGLAIPRLVRNTASEDGLELFISFAQGLADFRAVRSEEHTSELQSLMRISYAVFCLKKKNKKKQRHNQI